jgi:TRAP-type C4-dicarboxylate transport system permease large subunit
MGETIPPCINIIILGSVANISIGGLFAAGILPAITMAAALIVVAIPGGSRRQKGAPAVGQSAKMEQRSDGGERTVATTQMKKGLGTKNSTLSLLVGTGLTLIMMVIIFGGILGGIATPTEVSHSRSSMHCWQVDWLSGNYMCTPQ